MQFVLPAVSVCHQTHAGDGWKQESFIKNCIELYHWASDLMHVDCTILMYMFTVVVSNSKHLTKVESYFPVAEDGWEKAHSGQSKQLQHIIIIGNDEGRFSTGMQEWSDGMVRICIAAHERREIIYPYIIIILVLPSIRSTWFFPSYIGAHKHLTEAKIGF